MVAGKFLNDEAAVEGLPMRLVVTAVLLSAILVLCGTAAYNFLSDAKEKKLMGELNLIEKRAALMYVQGGARDVDNPDDFSGTMDNVHISIPDNAAFVVFGAMPGRTRDIHTDNIYYYVLTSGKVQVGSSIARFSAGDTNLSEPVVLYPGDYELTLELVKNKNGTYVKIE